MNWDMGDFLNHEKHGNSLIFNCLFDHGSMWLARVVQTSSPTQRGQIVVFTTVDSCVWMISKISAHVLSLFGGIFGLPSAEEEERKG